MNMKKNNIVLILAVIANLLIFLYLWILNHGNNNYLLTGIWVLANILWILFWVKTDKLKKRKIEIGSGILFCTIGVLTLFVYYISSLARDL